MFDHRLWWSAGYERGRNPALRLWDKMVSACRLHTGALAGPCTTTLDHAPLHAWWNALRPQEAKPPEDAYNAALPHFAHSHPERCAWLGGLKQRLPSAIMRSLPADHRSFSTPILFKTNQLFFRDHPIRYPACVSLGGRCHRAPASIAESERTLRGKPACCGTMLRTLQEMKMGARSKPLYLFFILLFRVPSRIQRCSEFRLCYTSVSMIGTRHHHHHHSTHFCAQRRALL